MHQNHPLISSDVENLFKRLFDIHISSLVKSLFRSSAHFLIGFFDVVVVYIELHELKLQ